MITRTQSKLKAIAFITVAVGFATSQDAIVKYLSGSFPAYEIMAFRGLMAIPFLSAWQARDVGFKAMNTPLLGLVMVRSLILCSAYFSFILAIAVMPLANAVAIYFTMPFFMAAMVGKGLGEKVPLYRWLAIAVGFIGVVITLRPGVSTFQPASLLALYSAFGYAVGQMMSRHISQTVSPIVISNWQNLFYIAAAIVIGAVVYGTGYAGTDVMPSLTKTFQWPGSSEIGILVLLGIFSAISATSFISAYQNAEANFVAPFEYTAMIWAVLFGVFVFNDFPDIYTWIGAAVVIGAGLFMLVMDHSRTRTLAPVPN
jgi:drug/metabolite transporter (DMT)-like permease